jgi:carbamoyltransferase
MLILGITGGNKLDDQFDENGFFHDGAATILRDGEIVAAIEEERLSRFKHSNCFPLRAIQYCLDECKCTLDEVDLVAVNRSVFHSDLMAKMAVIEDPTLKLPPDGRVQLAALFHRCFGVDVSRKLYFCNHHLAHAWSTFALSGFEKSLILSIDGEGDGCSGMVLTGESMRITKLRSLTLPQSLGHVYENLIRIVGYGPFDEYKVMGLAPYGNPETFRSLFEKCYALLPEGNFHIEPQMTWFSYFDSAGLIKSARRKGEPFTQTHKDFAAALQATIEKIVLHVLHYYRERTRQENLCLAGGVAHNCTMNGKALYSGLFNNVFVQPAAHDAGTALGAALGAWHEHSPACRPQKLSHVYLGTDIGDDAAAQRTLNQWSNFLSYAYQEDIAASTAKLLAEGAVVGWVQGKSEFGPRALGNRSILADPRPAENKLRINQMIKKREEYRPFAPSVLEERAGEFFDLPPGCRHFPFMIFVLRVRKEVRDLLGAITHVDGTARVQTVSHSENPLYWKLIHEFDKLTQVPLLLNTSFNNNAEPIVDSLEDAITCFLTTGINYLVVGNFIASKKEPVQILEAMPSLAPELPPFRKLSCQLPGERPYYAIESTKKSRPFGLGDVEISGEMFRALQHADSNTDFSDLLKRADVAATQPLLAELFQLWAQRVVRLHSVSVAPAEEKTAVSEPALVLMSPVP